MSASTHAFAQEHEEGHHGPHVLPIKLYLAVWGTLVVLTAITVAVSRFDFGTWNTVIAIVIATIKATIVALFFMHLKYDNKFNAVVFLAGLLFVSIFFFPVLVDLRTRGDLEPVRNELAPDFVSTHPQPETNLTVGHTEQPEHH
jgi:cytochrome c oxidase subunit 4